MNVNESLAILALEKTSGLFECLKPPTSSLCASASSATIYRKNIFVFFFLAVRAVSLRSLSEGNILHLNYGDPSKLLLLEMLSAAAKSRTIH